MNMGHEVARYDPYVELPFDGYLCDLAGKPERYWSLMHFLESAKLSGVDDQYRRFLLSIRDRDDFQLETTGISCIALNIERWQAVRLQAIYAGLFMQLAQNKSELQPILLSENFTCAASPIVSARGELIERLTSPDPLRRILFLGLERPVDNVIFSAFDKIFAKRKPDEIIVLGSSGLSFAASRYAHEHYIPIRVVGSECENAVQAALEKASHVFQIGEDQEVSELTITAYSLAGSLQKPTFKMKWEH